MALCSSDRSSEPTNHWRVKAHSARILMLPADPLAHRFDFDDEFQRVHQTMCVTPAMVKRASLDYF
jgi:hypothetical protein